METGYLLVFLTATISGFSIFINKFGVSFFQNPYLFTFLKNVVVSIFLSGLLIFFKDFKKIKKFSKRDWLFLVLIGFVGGSFPFLLFFKGLSLASAAESSFIHKTMFIYATIFAILFLKEKIEKRFLLATSILVFANLILLKRIPPSLNFGNFLVFLATLLWAIENTISKYALRTLEGRQVAWGRMFFGSIFILVYLAFTNQLSPILALNLKQIHWVLITSLLLFGYVLSWYSGLKKIPLHQATTILLFGGPITTILNLIFGGKVSQAEIFSTILIFFGILIALGAKRSIEILKSIKNLFLAKV